MWPLLPTFLRMSPSDPPFMYSSTIAICKQASKSECFDITSSRSPHMQPVHALPHPAKGCMCIVHDEVSMDL